MTGHRFAVLGTPSHPGGAWSESNLADLRARGFTAVQLNIAWSYRPDDEPLNLEDVWPGDRLIETEAERVLERQTLMRDRADLAHAHGLRTLLHVGLPFQGRAGFDGRALPNCISDPEVARRYAEAVAAFARACPEVDDLLIYTYDQDAWLCSEFEGCDRCAGVPLHVRLPPFLSAVAQAWAGQRSDGRVWWEPWELSAGQTLECIPRLDPSTTGLMLHSSIAEVISTIPADRFFRNAAGMAARAGIPVVAELFLSSSNEEVEPWRRLPVPLVTVRQLRDIERVPGVKGVKEYFGIVPSPFDVNLAAATAYFADPGASDETILGTLSRQYGLPWLTQFWTHASQAYELFPWDASWFARQLGRSHPHHARSAATVRGEQSGASLWDTPAWRSTRGSLFMRTSNDEPHPWLLEDVGLRCSVAAREMERAVAVFAQNFAGGEDEAARELEWQADEAVGFIVRATAYSLHIRLTLVAAALREGRGDRSALHRELRALLEADLLNVRRESSRSRLVIDETVSQLQREERWVVDQTPDSSEYVEAARLAAEDLDRFLTVYLLPAPDSAIAGQFSLTSR